MSGDIAIRDISIALLNELRPLRLTDGTFRIDNGTVTGTLSAAWLQNDRHTLQMEIASFFHKPVLSASVRSTCPAASFSIMPAPARVSTTLSMTAYSTSSAASRVWNTSTAQIPRVRTYAVQLVAAGDGGDLHDLA